MPQQANVLTRGEEIPCAIVRPIIHDKNIAAIPANFVKHRGHMCDLVVNG
jgi:hypothetical protein